ncbi:unnamed protein product [Vitrella brassicaformis CCMP3155]|uniref:ADP,ATP carrier protein n=1 Tax=Vitrella brassicaformis (strain CCMP3155) TaxID=1169540 RepID=A0A0G4GI26_VITBC|nr:unnamed protein product [Vitrella brassicaformis CCMP3155]|mmetsp:Transcript_6787/g.16490  ORF Transcript_6787/g.16490 Transcript_6787/m.16490 type:complete len:405 (-) Transcript_6787:383-1597(-)|eukprot:CEM29411.1 unnamed protein product [Vitrella brassicaformis CCMP3155]
MDRDDHSNAAPSAPSAPAAPPASAAPSSTDDSKPATTPQQLDLFAGVTGGGLFEDEEERRRKKKQKRAVSEEKLFAFTLLGYGGAAAASRVLTAPLDRVKVILQCQACFRGTTVTFNGLTDAATHIWRHQGWRAFWWGFSPHMWNVFVGTGVRLLTYQKLRLFFLPGGEDAHHGAELVVRETGCFIGSSSVALLVSYPFDVLFTRLATDGGRPGAMHKRTFKGLWHCIWTTVQTQGFSPFYRGCGFCMASSVPFLFVALGAARLYEDHILTRIQPARTTPSRPSTSTSGDFPPTDQKMVERSSVEPLRWYPWNLLGGMASGLLAQTATYPLDTIRRRYQYDGSSPWSDPPWTRQFASIAECARHSCRRGLGDLYRGAGVNALKVVPEAMVICCLYWIIKTKIPP